MVSRSLSFRLIALVVALLGSLAAPASALTHGWLHEHAAHEQADHHAQEASHATAVAHAAVAHTAVAHTAVAHTAMPVGAEVEEQDTHHRHGHDAVDVGPATRDGLRLILLVATAPTTSPVELRRADFAAVPTAALSHRAVLARSDPGGTSPPTLRAPPVS